MVTLYMYDVIYGPAMWISGNSVTLVYDIFLL